MKDHPSGLYRSSPHSHSACRLVRGEGAPLHSVVPNPAPAPAVRALVGEPVQVGVRVWQSGAEAPLYPRTRLG